jgi:hypothetical protein
MKHIMGLEAATCYIKRHQDGVLNLQGRTPSVWITNVPQRDCSAAACPPRQTCYTHSTRYRALFVGFEYKMNRHDRLSAAVWASPVPEVILPRAFKVLRLKHFALSLLACFIVV